MRNSETAITVEQARANRNRFLENSNLEYSAFTYDYAEFKKFMEFVESEKEKGVDIKYITVYLSQYENGNKSAFIAPLKRDGTPNYDIKALNHGSVSPPINPNSRQATIVRY